LNTIEHYWNLCQRPDPATRATHIWPAMSQRQNCNSHAFLWPSLPLFTHALSCGVLRRTSPSNIGKTWKNRSQGLNCHKVIRQCASPHYCPSPLSLIQLSLLNLWDFSVGRSQTFEPNKEKSGAKPLVKPWVDGSFWTSNQSVKRAVPFWSSTFVGTAVKLDNWVVIIVLHDTHLLTRLAISPPFAKESALQWHHLRAPALGSCTDGQGTLEKSTPG